MGTNYSNLPAIIPTILGPRLMLLRIQPRLNLGARPDAFFHSLLHPTVPREYVRAHDHALELRHADKKRRDAEARRAAEERAIQAKLDAGPDPDDPATTAAAD